MELTCQACEQVQTRMKSKSRGGTSGDSTGPRRTNQLRIVAVEGAIFISHNSDTEYFVARHATLKGRQ